MTTVERYVEFYTCLMPKAQAFLAALYRSRKSGPLTRAAAMAALDTSIARLRPSGKPEVITMTASDPAVLARMVAKAERARLGRAFAKGSQMGLPMQVAP